MRHRKEKKLRQSRLAVTLVIVTLTFITNGRAPAQSPMDARDVEEEARGCLKTAFALDRGVRAKALDEAACEPLWRNIGRL
jgi:hypothetical protein